MINVYLLIGGNLGNRVENLDKAVLLLNQRAGKVTEKSGIYQTAPWGLAEQAPFLNQALMLQTDSDAGKLLDTILGIELEMGRTRKEKNGPRIIDIDIMFYGNEMIDHPNLKVPHPHMQERRFALVPLNDLCPEFIHPVLHKTIKRLLDECPDTLDVDRYGGSISAGLQ
jgi:2-amino-4-hydroxy-6-hydroxymethyldihydropteridine diphosphokinase